MAWIHHRICLVLSFYERRPISAIKNFKKSSLDLQNKVKMLYLEDYLESKYNAIIILEPLRKEKCLKLISVIENS